MDLKTWIRKNPDRAGAWLAIVLGGVALLLGWQGASTTEYPAEQLPYILSGGIGGALLVALGATLLISADLRDEWRKLDRIERRLTPSEPTAEPTAEPQTTADEELTVAVPSSNGRTRPLVAQRNDH